MEDDQDLIVISKSKRIDWHEKLVRINAIKRHIEFSLERLLNLLEQTDFLRNEIIRSKNKIKDIYDQEPYKVCAACMRDNRS